MPIDDGASIVIAMPKYHRLVQWQHVEESNSLGRGWRTVVGGRVRCTGRSSREAFILLLTYRSYRKWPLTRARAWSRQSRSRLRLRQ